MGLIVLFLFFLGVCLIYRGLVRIFGFFLKVF